MQQKNNLHFLIYNDSIAVVVKLHSNVNTFIIDTLNDYESLIMWMQVHDHNGKYQ